MAFCSQCGMELSPDQKFCSNCGQRLGTPAAVKEAPTPPQTTVTNPQAGKMLMLAGGLAMLGGCMATIGGIGAQSGGTRGFGILIFLIGLGTFIAGKLQHWWSWE